MKHLTSTSSAESPIVFHSQAGSFSERWADYCESRRLAFRMIDGRSPDALVAAITSRVFLWNFHHADVRDRLIAPSLLAALEGAGTRVFPDVHTRWHFDDKVAQKYLLESVGAPLVPTHVFVEQSAALAFARSCRYPVVFKLRRGASSSNVSLVRDFYQAKSLIRKAFTSGFQVVPSVTTDIRRKLRGIRTVRDIVGKISRFPANRASVAWANHVLGRERGYVYFQDFVSGNRYDTRVTVIGERAFVFTRDVRDGDFRASGGGRINYSRPASQEMVAIAFSVASQLRLQSAAFDFLISESGRPVIVEVSYSYLASAVRGAGGFFDRSFRFHAVAMWPQDAILEDLLSSTLA